MASITPGNGTFKADTAEGVLFEAAMYCQTLEDNPLANPSKINNVSLTVNTDTKIASITATIPLQFVQNAQGGLGVFVKEYLSNP